MEFARILQIVKFAHVGPIMKLEFTSCSSLHEVFSSSNMKLKFAHVARFMKLIFAHEAMKLIFAHEAFEDEDRSN